MSDRDTEHLTDPVRDSATGIWRLPVNAMSHWPRAAVTPWLRDRAAAMSGPWGRFYAACAVGFVFVFRPTSWADLAAIGLLTLITSLGRYRRGAYVIPAAAVGVWWGSWEAAVIAAGMLVVGHRVTGHANRPDELAMRLHLRVAELTKAPTRERYKRLETYTEARNRIKTLGRGTQWRRLIVPDDRPINPVPKWIRVDLQPPGAPYPVGGIELHYPASFPDDDTAMQQKVLDAISAKLPPYADGTPPILMGDWHTEQDWAYLTVARPMPRWVTLEDLPELPPAWDDVVPFGLTSPDNPLAALVDPDDTGDTIAVAIWNPDNEACPVPQAPHVIVIGPTGSYKTTVTRTLVRGAQDRMGARVDAIDGKREGAFAYLEGSDGGRETADPAVAKAWVLDAYAEMEARYQLNDQRRRDRQPPVRFRARVLVIDEGMSWLDQLARDPDINDLVFKLVDISRRGRTARIFIIWSTQRPDVQGVGGWGTVGQMRDQFGLRLAGAGSSETACRMVFGDSNGKLAGRIPKVPRGRFGMMIGEQFGVIQHAYVPDPLGKPDPDAAVVHVDQATDHLPQAPKPKLAAVPDPDQPARNGRTITP